LTTTGPTLRWYRVAVGVLAFEMLLLGLLAGVVPAWFYADFPLGRAWVAAMGPYNEHSTLDFGLLALAVGVVLVWAIARPGPALSRAAVIAALIFNLPHAAFHLTHPERLSPGDAVAQNAVLILATVVNVIALLLVFRRPAGLQRTQRVRNRNRQRRG